MRPSPRYYPAPYRSEGFVMFQPRAPHPPIPCRGVCGGMIAHPTPLQVRAKLPSCGRIPCDAHIDKLRREKRQARRGR